MYLDGLTLVRNIGPILGLSLQSKDLTFWEIETIDAMRLSPYTLLRNNWINSSNRILVSVCVCLFAISSETDNPNVLKFRGIISFGVQMVLDWKTCIFHQQPFAFYYKCYFYFHVKRKMSIQKNGLRPFCVIFPLLNYILKLMKNIFKSESWF